MDRPLHPLLLALGGGLQRKPLLDLYLLLLSVLAQHGVVAMLIRRVVHFTCK